MPRTVHAQCAPGRVPEKGVASGHGHVHTLSEPVAASLVYCHCSHLLSFGRSPTPPHSACREMLGWRLQRGSMPRLAERHRHHVCRPHTCWHLRSVGTDTHPTAQQLKLYVPSEAGMVDLASMLAQQDLLPGDVYCLYGEVGAGKSVFSRAFIRAVACDDQLPVPSPTFLLQNSYEADTLGEDHPPIHHFDLYRLKDTPAQAWERLNLKASFEQAVCLVEWPERLPAGLVPADRLSVAIAIAPSTPRAPHASQPAASVHDLSSSQPNDSDDEVDLYTDLRPRVVTLTPVGSHWQDRLACLEQLIKQQENTSPDSVCMLN